MKNFYYFLKENIHVKILIKVLFNYNHSLFVNFIIAIYDCFFKYIRVIFLINSKQNEKEVNLKV